MNPGTKAHLAFSAHAKSLGFDYQKHKVVGDHAFQRGKQFLKLVGTRDSGKVLIVFRSGVGRYEIQVAALRGL